jgi:short-subunit dehydrogenase
MYFLPIPLTILPNIPQHVAAQFASKGIDHIILLSRNTQRLADSDAPFVSKASPDVKVSTLRLDLADLASIPGVLKELYTLTQGEDVEVVFFNAARIQPNDVLSVSVEEIDEDFKVAFAPPDKTSISTNSPYRQQTSPCTSSPSTSSRAFFPSPNPPRP